MRKRKPVLLNGEALMADGKPLEFDAVNQEELDGKIDAPQVAQVGEVLTVEEVGEDGKPKKWKTQAVQTEPPDWNENDPTKPGYVKNRPFYKSDENPLGTLTFTATATNELAYKITEMGLDTISGIYNMTKIDVGGGVPKGQLRVVVSGQSYLTESESDRGHFSFSGSGISGHGYYRTGDATTITIDDGSMSLTVGEFYDVSFFDINSSGYVKIPTEYFSKEVFTQNSAPVKYGDGNQSTIQGDSTKATGYSSHAEGNGTKALEQSSHAEGSYTTASGGVSHAEGNYTTASGETSHAEGYCTEAFGSSSHAEGDHTVASNKNMHTSGKYNVIEPRYKIYYRTGNYFFNKNAEYYCSDTYTLNQKTGKFTLNNAIKKIFTQCMGKYVSMDSVSENVDGVFKVLSTASGSTANYYPCNYYYSETLANDIGTYSHIVGNGTSDTERSNAYTLDWEGNAWFAGDVYVHSTSGTNKDDGSKKLLDTSDLLAFAEEVKDVTIQKPTTAQVGQIVKVKAVDADGKITETETVDMPTQKHLKWITVHSSDLTEEKTEIVISTDSNGKTIASYNPIGLTLVLSTPADSTQTDNNGAPWIYPSATYQDNAIRVIGSISGWKTTARDNVFTFIGGSSAMSCVGNVNTQIATYKIDGYSLDGVKAFLNGTSNHFPIGTHIEVSILCESN